MAGFAVCAVDLLETLAYGLVPAALLLHALAILLARSRRRETVRATGFGGVIVRDCAARGAPASA